MIIGEIAVDRIIPIIDLQKFNLSCGENEVFINSISDFEIKINAVFDTILDRNNNNNEKYIGHLTLIQIVYFNKNLELIPIGLRVACKFRGSKKSIKLVKALGQNNNGYPSSSFYLRIQSK